MAKKNIGPLDELFGSIVDGFDEVLPALPETINMTSIL